MTCRCICSESRETPRLVAVTARPYCRPSALPGARIQNLSQPAPSMVQPLIHHRIRHKAGDSEIVIGPRPAMSTAVSVR
jgi:hypothetical protein